jgi:hypothetical protein
MDFKHGAIRIITFEGDSACRGNGKSIKYNDERREKHYFNSYCQ